MEGDATTGSGRPRNRLSKRGLQTVVAVLSLIPIVTGTAGIVMGPGYLGGMTAWSPDLDSQFRFFSGIFLAVGLTFWSTIPAIERKTIRFRSAAALIFAGGLARLLSLALVGVPAAPHLGGLGMELIVVPLLVLWQARLAAAR